MAALLQGRPQQAALVLLERSPIAEVVVIQQLDELLVTLGATAG